MKDINLLPDDIRQAAGLGDDGNPKGVDIKPLIFGLAIFLALIVIYFIPQMIKSTIENKIETVKVEMEKKKSEYAQVDKVKEELGVVKKDVDDKMGVISSIDQRIYTVNEIYKAMQGVAPTGCVVETFNFNDKTCTISGTISNEIMWAEMVSRINRISVVDTKLKQSIKLNDNIFNLSFDITGK